MHNKNKENKMKKLIAALLIVCALTNVSYAQMGGFKGPSVATNKIITVKQALTLRDDSKVVLKGRIINSLGNEKYTFSDGTAEVIIDIDDKDWAGRTVTPEDTIEIVGEVDKEMFKPTEIDVDSFTIF